MTRSYRSSRSPTGRRLRVRLELGSERCEVAPLEPGKAPAVIAAPEGLFRQRGVSDAEAEVRDQVAGHPAIDIPLPRLRAIATQEQGSAVLAQVELDDRPRQVPGDIAGAGVEVVGVVIGGVHFEQTGGGAQ